MIALDDEADDDRADHDEEILSFTSASCWPVYDPAPVRVSAKPQRLRSLRSWLPLVAVGSLLAGCGSGSSTTSSSGPGTAHAVASHHARAAAPPVVTALAPHPAGELPAAV